MNRRDTAARGTRRARRGTAAESAASARPSAALLEGLLLGAIVLAAALARLRFVDVPLERDEGEYATMAELLLSGGVPYVDAHNMKLPGIYYAYAAILAVLGPSAWAVRVGLLLLNLVSIVLVHRLARRLFDASTALVAAAIFAALSLDDSMLGFTANAEHFVVAAMLGGLLLLSRLPESRSRLAIAAGGALLGLGVLMKQHGASFVAFGGLWVVLAGAPWRERAWGRVAVDALIFAAAALAPLALTAGAMAILGAFEPFRFWTFTYASRYAALYTLGEGLGELGRRLRAIGSSSTGVWLLAALGAGALAWDAQARQRALFLGGFALFSFLAVFPGLRFTDHYFLLVVPAASLLAAIGVSALARLAGAGSPRAAAALRVGLTLAAVGASLWQDRALLLAESPIAVSRAIYGEDPFPEAVEIACSRR